MCVVKCTIWYEIRCREPYSWIGLCNASQCNWEAFECLRWHHRTGVVLQIGVSMIREVLTQRVFCSQVVRGWPALLSYPCPHFTGHNKEREKSEVSSQFCYPKMAPIGKCHSWQDWCIMSMTQQLAKTLSSACMSVPLTNLARWLHGFVVDFDYSGRYHENVSAI